MDDVKHLSGIVVSAQFHYLPEREGRGLLRRSGYPHGG
jgi:hypothetical protein